MITEPEFILLTREKQLQVGIFAKLELDRSLELDHSL